MLHSKWNANMESLCKGRKIIFQKGNAEAVLNIILLKQSSEKTVCLSLVIVAMTTKVLMQGASSCFTLSEIVRGFSNLEIQKMSSRLISKNLKIKIYKTIILPVLLYRCETFSLT